MATNRQSAVMCASAAIVFGVGAALMFERDTFSWMLVGITSALLACKWTMYAVGYALQSRDDSMEIEARGSVLVVNGAEYGDAFADGRAVNIAVNAGRSGTRVFVDGREVSPITTDSARGA